MRFTVLGAGGFVGSHLVRHLLAGGHDCRAVGRTDPLPRGHLGHVVYCIGLTADFRTRWRETVQAHVCLLAEYLATIEADSFLYLSSTRVYRQSDRGDEEDALSVSPLNPSDLYNLTKLTGESACFASGRPGVRVARLSSVYGPDFESHNFLPSLIRASVDEGSIGLQMSRDVARDYVSIADVVALLARIAASGTGKIYNVASGGQVSNGALVARLATLTGCAVEAASTIPTGPPQAISIARVRSEFGFQPRLLLDDLPGLVDAYRMRPR